MLVKWGCEQADKQGVDTYLDTQLNGKGQRMYERQGFVKVDECSMDLQPFGSNRTHTHIGMVRKWQPTADK